MEDYVQILLESLIRKEELLDKIIEKNAAQAECLADKAYEDVDWDTFNLLVTEKEILIDRINAMDEGFQNLFDRVKGQLEENKDKYADSIRKMQDSIKRLSDKSIEIQTGEERNRRTIDSLLIGQKKAIKTTRNSLRVADSYQQAMSKNYGGSYSTMSNKK